MNSKSRRFLLYTLCALMALTQVAFVGFGKNQASEESVINNTNEIVENDITNITETKETTATSDMTVTDETVETVATDEQPTMAASSNFAEAIVVDATEIVLMEEEFLGEEPEGETSKYQDMIVSYADPYLPVRTGASRDTKTVGKLYPGSYADIVERGEEWTKIKSGKVEGYIQNIYVCFDDEAEDLSKHIKGKLTTALTLEEDEKRKATPTGGGTVTAGTYDVCLLAAIIDWEANAECYDGKVAVGTVVLNRVKSARYPNSIQAVLLAPGQFGGVMSGGGFSSAFQQRINNYQNGKGKADCIKAANDALAGANPLNGTYYYFNTTYGGNVSMVQQIGNHYFYNY